MRDLRMGLAQRCPQYPYHEFDGDTDRVYVSYIGNLDCRKLWSIIDTLQGVGSVRDDGPAAW